MGFFRRSSYDPMAQASALLERITDAQAKQVEVFSKFLEMTAELAAKRAASVLGQRSGRARKARKASAEQTARVSGCPLCVDPLYSNVTNEMILEHRRHVPFERSASNGAGLHASQLAPDEPIQ